ncbi:MAG TPA: epoxide hydrolase N-terminal domain-containing protein, partial [Chthoniobacteraceae bacterium]|nr:epoxide hydrolase N-terminal domain-containing protein [Chthoniobacteraceae bacterium]
MNTLDHIEITSRVALRGDSSGSITRKYFNETRPFRVNVPEAELTELRRRIKATKWPERETVKDASQGVQLSTIQALASYWATEYDWRKIETKLNAVPQF